MSPPSPRRGTVTIAVSFLVALMLTALPLPHWAEPWRPAWVTLVLAYWVLALPHRVGVGVGWGLGLLLDVLTGALLGQHALSLSLVAFLALRLHQRLRVLSPWEQGVSIFLLVVLDRAKEQFAAVKRVLSDPEVTEVVSGATVEVAMPSA